MTKLQTNEILLGASIEMQKVRALIERVAPTALPVLIAGPTGSGKELVAKAIHAASGRTGSLVSFNVCAIAETMFEDALFGHVRGAFTGAVSSAPGFLREAHRGTAFLDEIGGMNAQVQAKLLRAIETQEFRPVGATADVQSDFRLVAAANEDIWNLEQAGRFRADLAHRFSVFVIRLPSLREHVEDIPQLVRSFIRDFGGDSEVSIGREAADVLTRYAWPGNVRELRHVVLSALTLGRTGKLRPEDIREALSWRSLSTPTPPAQTLANRRLVEVLENCGWDTDEAARQLNVHKTTIYRRMKRVGIEKSMSGAVLETATRDLAIEVEGSRSA